MAQRESNEQALKRWNLLRLVQEHYADFETFLDDSMAELGFKATAIQKDIARYVDKGPKHLMVQAQRGAAKTTIASAYAVWSLIHNPATRILIFSAGNDMAKQISTAIVRLINAMETLACLRPDTNAGDRSSVESFDVHHSLKGLERSPSVKCISIGSNMAGNRADILIADD